MQCAVSVPLRTSLRCSWNMLCSLASHHQLLLAGSKYQTEISHRSSPKTAPTLSQQQTFMAYSLRHLCPPNNSRLQICLHMQSNRTALSRDACFLVAFLGQPLFYHPFKKVLDFTVMITELCETLCSKKSYFKKILVLKYL